MQPYESRSLALLDTDPSRAGETMVLLGRSGKDAAFGDVRGLVTASEASLGRLITEGNSVDFSGCLFPRNSERCFFLAGSREERLVHVTDGW